MNGKRRWMWCGVLAWVVAGALQTQAAPWAVTAGYLEDGGTTGAISTVDMGTVPPTVYGPFLAGQLGTNGGGLFDVAIAPGNVALVSGFGDSVVYKIDITDPQNPVLMGETNLPFFAEDIAVSPNGQFALVTDGGFSPGVAYLDLATFTVTHLALTSGYANAVAIANDNETVLLADYFLGMIWYGQLNINKDKDDPQPDPDPVFVEEKSIDLTYNVEDMGRPVNVTISPDGRTALVSDAATGLVHVLEIKADGTVQMGATPRVPIHADLNAKNQSVAFTRDSKKAYVTIQLYNEPLDQFENFVSWLQINGPGNVSLGGSGVAKVAPEGSSQLFGVDTIALTPDGKQVLYGNPTVSGASNFLSVVDTTTWGVTLIDSKMFIPIGVAIQCRNALNDYDGDGQSDMSLYWSANGTWYALTRANAATLYGAQWGYKGALPVPGDYDGDGIGDQAVYDLKTMKWYIRSTGTQGALAFGLLWGQLGATPVTGDYDGDGSADPAFYNPNSGRWYAWSLTKSAVVNGTQWGYKGALPKPGDYDGDGIADLAIYDPQNGNWFVRSTASSTVLIWGQNWGFAGALAIPGDYNGDGSADLAVYSRFSGKWYIRSVAGDVLAFGRQWGYAGAEPVSGDFDGDGISDLAVYDPIPGKWFIQSMAGQVLVWGKSWGFRGAQTILP